MAVNDGEEGKATIRILTESMFDQIFDDFTNIGIFVGGDKHGDRYGIGVLKDHTVAFNIRASYQHYLPKVHCHIDLVGLKESDSKIEDLVERIKNYILELKAEIAIIDY